MTPQRRREIEHDCLFLCNAFAFHLDRAEFTQVASLFTPDGVFERNGERLQSRSGILAGYANRPAVTICHLVTNVHLLEVRETVASGVSSALVIHAMGVSDQILKFDPSSAIRVLEFEDRYQLCDEGWRFSFRLPRARLQSLTWPGT